MMGSWISEASGAGNGSQNILSQKRTRRSLSSGDEAKRRSAMMLMDLDILDCPICYEALTILIFQCANGHIACSSCCPKLRNKCPACALPIGHSRCRAMEKVVKSVSFPCPNSIFGCTESSSNGKESTHEKECNFSPCSCPEQDCNYTGPYKDLYNHYALTHSKGFGLNSFSCGVSFNSLINIGCTMKIEKEYVKRLLFAVQCFKEPCGVYLTVSCIAPSTPEVGEYSYHVSYNVDDGHTLTYGLWITKNGEDSQSEFSCPSTESHVHPEPFLAW